MFPVRYEKEDKGSWMDDRSKNDHSRLESSHYHVCAGRSDQNVFEKHSAGLRHESTTDVLDFDSLCLIIHQSGIHASLSLPHQVSALCAREAPSSWTW